MKTLYFFLKAMILGVITIIALTGCNQLTKKTGEKTKNPEIQPGLSLGIASIPNLRDLGGYKTKDNHVIATGLLYRSNQLSQITAADMEKLAALGLKNDFDLRTEAERNARPDELPVGVNYVVLDALADADQAGPAMLEKLLSDPSQANAALGNGKAEAGFMVTYRQFITLPSARKAFSELFSTISNKDEVPALFHCTTGKDRTGWAAAAFLTLMGVPVDTVYKDYLRSNEYILPLYKAHIDAFVSAGGDPSIPNAIFGVKREYLDAAFEEMEKNYGTIENYFTEALGINEQEQMSLKDIFLN